MDRIRISALDLGKADAIVESVEEFEYEYEASLKGASDMCSLSTTVLYTNNPEFYARMLDAGVCEFVVNMLSKHGMNSEQIAADCCNIVKNLSFGNRDLAEHFATCGACETVVFVASIHIGSPEVADAAVGAIGMLARNNISNSFELAQHGACDVLAQLGNFGFNIKHPLCAQVAGQVCYAYSQLAEASNVQSIMEAGACDLIVSLLWFHVNNKKGLNSSTDNDVLSDASDENHAGLTSAVSATSIQSIGTNPRNDSIDNHYDSLIIAPGKYVCLLVFVRVNCDSISVLNLYDN